MLCDDHGTCRPSKVKCKDKDTCSDGACRAAGPGDAGKGGGHGQD
jgi:hypothetical protein